MGAWLSPMFVTLVYLVSKPANRLLAGLETEAKYTMLLFLKRGSSLLQEMATTTSKC